MARRRNISPSRIPHHPLLWGLALVLLLGLLCARMKAIPQGSDLERYQNKSFMCTRVIDGDTLLIDAPEGYKPTTKVRLWGVDTPESVKVDQAVMYFGKEASEFTRTLLEHQLIRIVLYPEKTRGKYGRLLAYVYLVESGLMVNEELIARGFGYADRRFEHPWRTRFVQLEKKARKAKLGLWAEVTVEQMPDWRQRYEAWRESVRPESEPPSFIKIPVR